MTSPASEPRDASPPPGDGTSASAPEAEPRTLRNELTPYFHLIRQAQYGAARVRLRKHLNLNPGDGQAEFLFGLTYHEEKRYARAVPWYEKALEHEPEYDAPWYFYAWAQYYLGKPTEAMQAFEHHLEMRPEEPDTHFGLGLIALDEDRLDDAERRFEHAIALQQEADGHEQDLSKAYVNLAEVHVRRQQYETARDELIKAAELHPDHYEAFYKLSLVYARLGETEKAEAARQTFLETRQRAQEAAGRRPKGEGIEP